MVLQEWTTTTTTRLEARAMRSGLGLDELTPQVTTRRERGYTER